jgi:DedD protein
MSGNQDTEITLGVGRLLGMFFGLVILCAISLGAGYWLGRNSVRQEAAGNATGDETRAARAHTSGIKPGAATAAVAKTSDCAAGDNCTPQATTPNSADLTFYQSVRQDNPQPKLTPPETPASAAPAADPHATLGTGFMVQIAAVRNQDDANLLRDTLQKQQFPVIITQPGDKLFHVQVGPYADVKEADSIRSRLVESGYNPILKH